MLKLSIYSSFHNGTGFVRCLDVRIYRFLKYIIINPLPAEKGFIAGLLVAAKLRVCNDKAE